jgi:hypothetical protein
LHDKDWKMGFRSLDEIGQSIKGIVDAVKNKSLDEAQELIELFGKDVGWLFRSMPSRPDKSASGEPAPIAAEVMGWDADAIARAARLLRDASADISRHDRQSAIRKTEDALAIVAGASDVPLR